MLILKTALAWICSTLHSISLHNSRRILRNFRNPAYGIFSIRRKCDRAAALILINQCFAELATIRPRDIEHARKLLMQRFQEKASCYDKKLLAWVWKRVQSYAELLVRGRLI